jgi:hypothetical protein
MRPIEVLSALLTVDWGAIDDGRVVWLASSAFSSASVALVLLAAPPVFGTLGVNYFIVVDRVSSKEEKNKI